MEHAQLAEKELPINENTSEMGIGRFDGDGLLNRGVGNDEFTRNCKEISKVEKPDIMNLVEDASNFNMKVNYNTDQAIHCFNDIASIDEREGSNLKCIERIINFREHWNNCNLFDAGWSNNKFTWLRRHHDQVVLQERLDKALTNVESLDLFPNLNVTVLPRHYSDHHPIMVETNFPLGLDKIRRPLRFEALWLTHPDFKSIFNTAMERKKHSITEPIEETGKDIQKKWKETALDNIFKQKRILRNRLKGIQRSPNYFQSKRLQDHEKLLDEDYQKIVNQEEILWLQKSRLDWVLKGERNTKFFHITAKI
ncbi:hypothetical protein F3Y22_tig00110458pilonHSYRG00002 [Hibiscus syriacus]|uniref:Uncharacterized protein n=1 Tax=Hibiscus syriacus TaxID=106335 RepID=A0A6A3AJ68_HIBSY|nr:hypothetical protein F3Y22_tig00110458pilonHSYRG00002 [Hibiscus syriacus]